MFTFKQMSKNSTNLFPTSKGIARGASSAHPSTTAFPTATDISDIQKIRVSTYVASLHPFSS
jgi:hypothetical protein